MSDKQAAEEEYATYQRSLNFYKAVMLDVKAAEKDLQTFSLLNREVLNEELSLLNQTISLIEEKMKLYEKNL